MIPIPSNVRVWLATGHTDMRRGFNGLALQVQEALKRDLRYWRGRLATARLAPRPAGNVVAIGTRVAIEQSGKTRVLEIVGQDEAEPGSGRIAWSAPLARELIGTEPGDHVASHDGKDRMMVVSIEVIE